MVLAALESKGKNMGNTKSSECNGCTHWKPLYPSSAGGTYPACHYCIDTGRTRYSMGAWGKCTVKEDVRLNDFKETSGILKPLP